MSREKEHFFEQELATLNNANEEGPTVMKAWSGLLDALNARYSLEHPEQEMTVKVHHAVDGNSLKITARFYRLIKD